MREMMKEEEGLRIRGMIRMLNIKIGRRKIGVKNWELIDQF